VFVFETSYRVDVHARAFSSSARVDTSEHRHHFQFTLPELLTSTTTITHISPEFAVHHFQVMVST
jgi:hypothetical protein